MNFYGPNLFSKSERGKELMELILKSHPFDNRKKINLLSQVSLIVGLLFGNTVFAKSEVSLADSMTASTSSFKTLGVAPRITILQDPVFENLYDKNDRYFLKVQLGQLDRSQFDSLKKFYKNQSAISYTPNREYELLDFLSPSIQAFANKRFKYKEVPDVTNDIMNSNIIDKVTQLQNDSTKVNPQEDKYGPTLGGLFYLSKQGLSLATNCWNTSIEVLNQMIHPDQAYTMRLPGRLETDELIKNPKNFEEIKGGLKNAQPFDLITVSRAPGKDDFTQLSDLQHTAIYLGHGLIYEKVDSSENDPYKVSFYNSMLNKFYSALNNKVSVKFYRVKSGADLSYSHVEFEKQGAEAFFKMFESKIKRNFPFYSSKNLGQGTEVGLGGGSTPYYYLEMPVKVVIDSSTQKGLVQLPNDFQNRLIPLVEQNYNQR